MTEIEDRPKYRPFQHADWREGVEDFLITGGTNGRKQHQIVERFHLAADAPTILAHLESLRAEKKVDTYKLPTKGRPAIIWRATTEIMK